MVPLTVGIICTAVNGRVLHVYVHMNEKDEKVNNTVEPLFSGHAGNEATGAHGNYRAVSLSRVK